MIQAHEIMLHLLHITNGGVLDARPLGLKSKGLLEDGQLTVYWLV